MGVFPDHFERDWESTNSQACFKSSRILVDCVSKSLVCGPCTHEASFLSKSETFTSEELCKTGGVRSSKSVESMRIERAEKKRRAPVKEAQ